MFWLQKIYCRGVQAAFRLALPLLPHRRPKLLDSVGDIPKTLGELGLKKPLILTGRHVYGAGLTKGLENGLTNFGVAYEVFARSVPNPTTAVVEEAAEVYRAAGCDCLIAFGGGSPMDTAKAARARIARPNKSLQSMAGLLKVRKRGPVLFAVPTTAGSGSETTLAAVIVDSESRHKYVINDFALIPEFAVTDGENLTSLSAGTIAETGLDALTHAVEAYIGRSTTKETRAWAEEAMTLIFENLEAAAKHESLAAQERMMQASFLAGNAFTRSYVGYVHALSHALSGKYDLPHGRTNATLLPIVLEEYGEKAAKKLDPLAPSGDFLADLKALEERLTIPTRIAEIRPEDIPDLAKTAAKEANPLYPVPVEWDARELERIYQIAKNGR